MNPVAAVIHTLCRMYNELFEAEKKGEEGTALQRLIGCLLLLQKWWEDNVCIMPGGPIEEVDNILLRKYYEGETRPPGFGFVLDRLPLQEGWCKLRDPNGTRAARLLRGLCLTRGKATLYDIVMETQEGLGKRGLWKITEMNRTTVVGGFRNEELLPGIVAAVVLRFVKKDEIGGDSMEVAVHFYPSPTRYQLREPCAICAN